MNIQMHQPHSPRLTLFVLAGAILLALVAPAGAEGPAALPPVALKADGTAGSSKAPTCKAPADLTRFLHPLPRVAQHLAAAQSVTIVAIGSSSTAGAGASNPANSYPSRLAVELQQRFPSSDIKVINRGVNGEESTDMLARLDSQVLAEKPDLILWQVGTNALLRNRLLEPAAGQIDGGVQRMKASGADVVLIDPQFAPKVLTKPEHEEMVSLIAILAKQGNVDLFRRFAVMRHWREVEGLAFNVFLSADELHMNDWSYACVAKVLAEAIAEAATRAKAIAQTPSLPASRASASR
jgi:acyl-CoA thioesterase I